jgi:hypothetical protein
MRSFIIPSVTRMRRLNPYFSFISSHFSTASLVSKENFILEGSNSMCSSSNLSSLNPAQHAFLSRIGYTSMLSDRLALAALNHPFKNETNTLFQTLLFLGAHAIKFFVSEALSIKYPKLPLLDLKNAIHLYTDEKILDKVVKKYGLFSAVDCSKVSMNMYLSIMMGLTLVCAMYYSLFL